MNIDDLQKIVAILKANDVTDFELNQGDTHIKLSREGNRSVLAPAVVQHMVAPAIVASNGVGAHSSPAPEAKEGGVPAHWVPVESPIVGTFYRKPSPDAPFFVQEGGAVNKGDTLCIVEAMKVMNEIDAPCAGKVERVLAAESSVVEYGEVLFFINPGA